MIKKILLGGLVTLVVGLLLGATGWNFAATQNAVDKTEHQRVHDNLDKKLDKIFDKIVEVYKEMPK